MTEILGPQTYPKCIKTHVQASIIQNFLGGDPPNPASATRGENPPLVLSPLSCLRRICCWMFSESTRFHKITSAWTDNLKFATLYEQVVCLVKTKNVMKNFDVLFWIEKFIQFYSHVQYLGHVTMT